MPALAWQVLSLAQRHDKVREELEMLSATAQALLQEHQAQEEAARKQEEEAKGQGEGPLVELFCRLLAPYLQKFLQVLRMPQPHCMPVWETVFLLNIMSEASRVL